LQLISITTILATQKLRYMKKLTWLLAASLFTVSCKKAINDVAPQEQLVPRADLDKSIKATVISTGQWDWNKATENQVWSALQQGDGILSIGYKPAGTSNNIESQIGNINIKATDWANAKAAVLQIVYENEKKLNADLKIEQLEAFDEEVLPVMDVHVRNIETIKALRASGYVRYAEPIGYEPAGFYNAQNSMLQSSSGCGSNNAEALTAPADYTSIAPGAYQSWNHGYHNISSAWGKTTGKGKRLMIIDTGLSPDQQLLNGQFNSGYSAGRNVQAKVTLRKSAWLGLSYGSVETSTADGCGHGTSMAGVAASPRNNFNGVVGIAYDCNLTVVRASTDVLIDEARETKGVSDAFTLAGNTADVSVVSMSLGRITSSSQISDAIAYANSKGKLIFCAAGTSFGWTAGWYGVIFPAWLSSVNAVTGIQDNLSSRCDACHDGSEVDFTVVMEKASNGRHIPTTAQSGYAASTVGGSSVATASTSAIATLIWAKNPSWTKQQVLDKMILSSSKYPTKSSTQGWGTVNADAATN
jgi:hypothetical protein